MAFTAVARAGVESCRGCDSGRRHPRRARAGSDERTTHAPGRAARRPEDLAGEPFVGPAGKLLTGPSPTPASTLLTSTEPTPCTTSAGRAREER